jgi:hypothetical protein
MTAGNFENVPEQPCRRARQTAGRILWTIALMAGCSAPGKSLVECPLSVNQQQEAVLAIVPPGTPRGLAEQRLKAAGIEFTPGGNGSIYYLSLWSRADGERWHINVALLFDQAGKLYQTRPADSTTSVASRYSAGNREAIDNTAALPGMPSHGERDHETSDGGAGRVAFPAQSAQSRDGTP